MSLSIAPSEDIGWDRTFLNISSDLAEPICWISAKAHRVVSTMNPQEFDNFPSRMQEAAYRAILVFSAFVMVCVLPLTLTVVATLGLASKAFKATGYALQKNGYTHIRGSAPEEPITDPTNYTLNACMIAGGLSRSHGGPVEWQLRIDRLIDEIMAIDAGTVSIQECYDTKALERLINGTPGHPGLGSKYAHFFTHLGPSVWGSEGGCLVMTKHAYSHFSHTVFSNSDWTLARGYAILELKKTPESNEPCTRTVATHLIDGYSEKDQARRLIQVSEIIEGVAERTLQVPKPIPTFLAGDLNINRDDAEDQRVLVPFLEHSYKGSEPTCTYTLLAKWDAKFKNAMEEIFDYFSQIKEANPRSLKVKEAQLLECRRISTYKPGDTRNSLSDHAGIYTKHALPR